MHLEGDKRLNLQLRLDFSSASPGRDSENSRPKAVEIINFKTRQTRREVEVLDGVLGPFRDVAQLTAAIEAAAASTRCGSGVRFRSPASVHMPSYCGAHEDMCSHA